MTLHTTEPRSIQDLLKTLETRGLPRAASVPESGMFVPEFGTCEEHGQWPANVQDASGVVRWMQPGCPVCRKNAQTQALVATADLSKRFLSCTFDNYRVGTPGQQIALKACREYAQNFAQNLEDGRCMILMGNPGTGKNHLSSAIMMEVMRQNHTTLRVKASSFLDEYWSKDFTEREVWMQRMASVDLLVIDEIGRASNGKSANDAFFRLIDSRYELVKPTIVTTNLNREALLETLGEASYDRLREGGGKRVVFNWNSEREIMD